MANKLNGGDINRFLKRKWGLNEFMEYTGTSNEEELREVLKRVATSSTNIDNIMREIKKNSKHNDKKQKKNVEFGEQANYIPVEGDKMSTSIPYTSPNVSTLLKDAQNSIQCFENKQIVTNNYASDPVVKFKEPVVNKCNNKLIAGNAENGNDGVQETTETAKLGNDEAEKNTDTIEDSNSGNEKIIENLREDLEAIDRQILVSKQNLETLNVRRKDISEVLNDICETLERLKNEIFSQKERFIETCNHASEINQQFENEMKNLEVLQNDREETYKQIQKLLPITMYCGNNEETTSFDYSINDFKFSNKEINERFMNLLESDFSNLIEEFSILELKQVVKIMLIIEKIENEKGSESKIELYFDDSSNFTSLLELMGKSVMYTK